MSQPPTLPPQRFTPAGAPDLDAVAQAMQDFCRTIATLRDPRLGCPWDLKQDHVSLRRYMIEEAYEAADAMTGDDAPALRDELGDVLLQVVLNSQVARDHGRFSLLEVIQAIDAKMRRRHPHVFGNEAERLARSSTEISHKWQAVKAAEKLAQTQKSEGLFSDLSPRHPASLEAVAIGKVAAKIKFDWADAAPVFEQVRAEVAELDAEMQLRDPCRLADEIGDIYFSLAQLCRHLHLDPEVVALDANRKFLRRAAAMEELAKKRGMRLDALTSVQLEDLWREVKSLEAGS